MKKITFLIALLLYAVTVSAQEKIAVFVYSTAKLKEPINALRSNIETALVNSAQKAYVVVDRTDEFQSILRSEYNYEGDGYVDDKQLLSIGKQLGVDKVCGVVITDYGSDGYYFECKILDAIENRIDSKARYPIGGDRIHDLGISSSEKVANELASQLNLLSIEQEKQNKAIQKQQEKAKMTIQRQQTIAYKKEQVLCFLSTPAGSLLSSTVVPGLGLINKGHTGWGTTFFLTEVGMITVIARTYNSAQNLLITMRNPVVTEDVFTAANTQYSKIKTTNHVFIGAAATIYCINIIATVASNNNSKHVCWIPAPMLDREGNIIPTFSFTYNF